MDAITIAKGFDKLKSTKSILVQGDDSWKTTIVKERSIENKTRLIEENMSSRDELAHSIRISRNNYEAYKNLKPNKSISQIINERTKIFALDIYHYVGDIKNDDKQKELASNLFLKLLTSR